jgi:mycofactocin system creatininase family protein
VSLGEARWPELDGRQDITLLVPVGSVEQHGPHLPLSTDTRIAEAVACLAAGPAVLVAPSINYGASGEHESFPGTVSIGHEALRAVLVEFGRSACRWAARVVFVNGHGGNVRSLSEAVRLLRAEGRDVAWHACGLPGTDLHAGHTETALLLAVAAQEVRMDAAQRGNTGSLAELLPAMQAGSVRAVSPSGVLGDPTGATAEDGRSLLAALAAALRSALAGWQPGKSGLLSH